MDYPYTLLFCWVAEVPSGSHRPQQCCAEQHVLMALKQTLVPCHLALFCLFFPYAYGRRRKRRRRRTCSAPGAKWLIALTALGGRLVRFEQEPHHTCGEVSGLLPCCGRCCQLCRGSGKTHCISCLFSVALADLWEQMKYRQGGRKGFLGKLPRSPFSASGELKVWIGI